MLPQALTGDRAGQTSVTLPRSGFVQEAFLAAGQAGLKSREPDLRDEENARLKQLLGDREMRLEIHRQAAKLRGYELPFIPGKRK